MTDPVPAFLIEYSDSSFTNPHEVVLPDEPKECTGDFTHMGAKYWGLETKRHCATTVLDGEQAFGYDHDAHHWFLIGLKRRTEIDRATISTKWFTGNQVRAVSLYVIDAMTGDETQVLDRAPLDPDSEHEFTFDAVTGTECRVEAYYEGGISRVNFFGAAAELQMPERDNLLEFAKITHVSNEHYGKPDHAVQGARKEMHMVGWESARTGFGERAVFHLRKPSVIEDIVVDTYLHRLNPPLASHVFGATLGEGEVETAMQAAPRFKLTFADGHSVAPDDFQAYMLEQRYLDEPGARADRHDFKISLHVEDGGPWRPVLPFAPLRADSYHRFKADADCGTVTHILYMHYPNGGIHGLKMFGTEE